MEPIRVSIVFDTAGQPQLRRSAEDLGRLTRQLDTLSANGASAGRVFRLIESDLNRFSAGLHRVTNTGVNLFNQAFERTFSLLGSFGRLTFYSALGQIAALTYGFQGLVREFLKVNEQFAGLEITLQSVFGSVRIARAIREELARITITSPLPLEDLSNATRAASVMPALSQRLALQAASGTLGQADGFLRQYTQLLEQLTTFRPDKQTEDAVFALREALTGELRSLIRRFEFPSSLLVQASGRPLDVLKRQPDLMFSALKGALDRIISPAAIAELVKQPSKLFSNIVEQAVKIPLLQIGRAGEGQNQQSFYQKLTEAGFSVLQRFGEFANVDSGSFGPQSRRLGAGLSGTFDRVVDKFDTLFEKLLTTLGAGQSDLPGSGKLERTYVLFERAIEFIAENFDRFIDKVVEVGQTAWPIFMRFLKFIGEIGSLFVSIFNFNPYAGLAAVVAFRNLPTIVGNALGLIESNFVKTLQNIRSASLLSGVGPLATSVAGASSGVAGGVAGTLQAQLGRSPFAYNQTMLAAAGLAFGSDGRLRHTTTGNKTGYFGQTYSVNRAGTLARPEQLPQGLLFRAGQKVEDSLARLGYAFDTASNQIVYGVGNKQGRAPGIPVTAPLPAITTAALNLGNLSNAQRLESLTGQRFTGSGISGFNFAQIRSVPFDFGGFNDIDGYLKSRGLTQDRSGRIRYAPGNTLGGRPGSFARGVDVELAFANREFMKLGSATGLTGAQTQQAYYNQMRSSGSGRIMSSIVSNTAGAAVGAGLGQGAAAGIASGVGAAASVLGPILLAVAATGAFTFLLDKASAYFEKKAKDRLAADEKTLRIGDSATDERSLRLGAELNFGRKLDRFLTEGVSNSELRPDRQFARDFGTREVKIPFDFTGQRRLSEIPRDERTTGERNPAAIAAPAFVPFGASSPFAPSVSESLQDSGFVSVSRQSETRSLDLPGLIDLRQRIQVDLNRLRDLNTQKDDVVQSTEQVIGSISTTDAEGNYLQKRSVKGRGQVIAAIRELNALFDSTTPLVTELVGEVQSVYKTIDGKPIIAFGAAVGEATKALFDRLTLTVQTLDTPAGFVERSGKFTSIRERMKAFEDSPDVRTVVEANEAAAAAFREQYQPFLRVNQVFRREGTRLTNLTELEKSLTELRNGDGLQTAINEQVAELDSVLRTYAETFGQKDTNKLGLEELRIRVAKTDSAGKAVIDANTGEVETVLVAWDDWAKQVRSRLASQTGQQALDSLAARTRDAMAGVPLNLVEALSIGLLPLFEGFEDMSSTASARLRQQVDEVLTELDELGAQIPNLFPDIKAETQRIAAPIVSVPSVENFRTPLEQDLGPLERSRGVVQFYGNLLDSLQAFERNVPQDTRPKFENAIKAAQAGVTKFTSKLTEIGDRLGALAQELQFNRGQDAFGNLVSGNLGFDTPIQRGTSERALQDAASFAQRRFDVTIDPKDIDLLRRPSPEFSPRSQDPFAREQGLFDFLTKIRPTLETRVQNTRTAVEIQEASGGATPEVSVAFQRAQDDLNVFETRLAELERGLTLGRRNASFQRFDRVASRLGTLTQERNQQQSPFINEMMEVILKDFTRESSRLPENFKLPDFGSQLRRIQELDAEAVGAKGLANQREQFQLVQDIFASLADVVGNMLQDTTLTSDEFDKYSQYQVQFLQQAHGASTRIRSLSEKEATFRGEAISALEALLTDTNPQNDLTAILSEQRIRRYERFSPSARSLDPQTIFRASQEANTRGFEGSSVRAERLSSLETELRREIEQITIRIAELESSETPEDTIRPLRNQLEDTVQKAIKAQQESYRAFDETFQEASALIQELEQQAAQPRTPAGQRRLSRIQSDLAVAGGPDFALGAPVQEALNIELRGADTFSGQVKQLKAFADEYTRLADLFEQRALDLSLVKGVDDEAIRSLERMAENFGKLAEAAQKAQEQISGRGGALSTFTEGFLAVNDEFAATAANWTDVGSSMARSLTENVSNSLVDVMVRAKDAGDAFREFGSAMLETAAQLVVNKTVEMILGSAFSGVGGLFGGGRPAGVSGPLQASGRFADGGLIEGASSDTDNRLIHVATGEYIVPSRAVRKYGVETFEAYREGKMPESLPVNLPRFADGGLVGGGVTTPAVIHATPVSKSSASSNTATVQISVPVSIQVNSDGKTDPGDLEQRMEVMGRGLKVSIESHIMAQLRQDGVIRQALRNR